MYSLRTAATAAHECDTQPRCAGCARPVRARRAHTLPDERRYCAKCWDRLRPGLRRHAEIALRQSEQLPKSNEKKLPLGLMCSTTFTIPKTPPLAVRMTNLSVLVNAIGSLASGS